LKNILLLSGVLFFISLILTFIIRRTALNHKILDIPNERSSHISPVPRGGGLAIVIIWYIGISVLYYLKYIESSLYFALLSGILLAIISLIDDLISLKPVIRLSAQMITAIASFVFLKGINPVSIPGIEINSLIILSPLVIIGIVWFINLYNFLDGIDGYASLEAITIAASMFIFTGSLINIILIACILGFLYWNWPKAKIFMGDIGSTQLGFILIVLGIYFHNKSELSIINWIMLTSLFWFDATLTLFRRWRNNEKLSFAHRKHVYQRAVQSGLSHQKTIVLSIGINVIIASLVFISRKYIFLLIPSFIINMLFLYGITFLIDRKVPFEKNQK
jgi:UDP-N-acetylmuramyl pentapeptide phosphotransferase/UDP-N-acetylglucosamine-1-phosphate transferase